MAGSFATLAVGDPHDTMQSLSEHFAPPAGETQQYWARTYEAADWRRYKIEPNAYRTLVSVGVIGGVGGQAGLACLSSFKDQAASKFSIKSPGLDLYYLSFLQEGSVNCANRERKPSWTKERGAIFRAEPQTALHTSDGSARLSVLLPVGLVRRHAAPLFSGSNVGDLDFDAPIDGLWAIADIMTKSGAAIRPIAELVAAPFRLGAER